MKNYSFLLLLVLFSCSGNKDPKTDGRSVFRYNESAGISSLDPAFTRNLENIWAVNQLFNGLVRMDSALNVEPAIARDWEISEDGLTYTFFLREDVFFHDSPVFENGKGRKVDAHDVVFSFKRLISPELAAPGMWVFSGVKDPLQTGISAVDDTTVQIKLSAPFPPFLSLLAMQYCAIVPQEAIEFYGNDFRENPVGTGPFKFHFWLEGERLVFLKNENYFEKDEFGTRLPYLDAVSVSFLKDKGAAFLEMLKGNFDFMSGLHSSYKDEILDPMGDLNEIYAEEYYLQKGPFLKTDYLGIMVDSTAPGGANSPLLNKSLRKAINHAIDREAMILYLRNNLYFAAHGGFVPRGMPSYSETEINGYRYNRKKASTFLAEAGYPNGEGLDPIVLSTTSDYADLTEYIQHQLGQVGIPVKVEVLPASNHREASAQGRLSFFRKSWIADYPDGENFLSVFHTSNWSPNGPNYMHYSNPLFDTWYEEAMQITSERERNRLYTRMDSLVMEDACVVPLYYDVVVRFVNKRVKDLSNNPLNLLDLRRVKMEKDQ